MIVTEGIFDTTKQGIKKDFFRNTANAKRVGKKALNVAKNPLAGIHQARVNRLSKKAGKLADAGKAGSSLKMSHKSQNLAAHTNKWGWDAKDAAIAGGGVAGMLGAAALMGLVIKKMRKNNPNSEVLREAERKVKSLTKELKQAQKDLKKAQTPAEAKAATKKIKKCESQITKLKTQIGRLADKNLSPKEVEQVKKKLTKMVAESVIPAYTEAELMFTEIQESTAAIMSDHYYALMLEAAAEDAEMEDIFGEDADDFDFEESFDDFDDFDFDF